MRQYKTCLVRHCRNKKGIANIQIEYTNGRLRGGLCPVHAKPLNELARVAGHHFIHIPGAMENRNRLRTRLEIYTMDEIEELKRERQESETVGRGSTVRRRSSPGKNAAREESETRSASPGCPDPRTG